jgi:hypothetical protein
MWGRVWKGGRGRSEEDRRRRVSEKKNADKPGQRAEGDQGDVATGDAVWEEEASPLRRTLTGLLDAAAKEKERYAALHDAARASPRGYRSRRRERTQPPTLRSPAWPQRTPLPDAARTCSPTTSYPDAAAGRLSPRRASRTPQPTPGIPDAASPGRAPVTAATQPTLRIPDAASPGREPVTAVTQTTLPDAATPGRAP